MNERTTQRGDGETAVCHVCDQRFSTQRELLQHLEERHPDEVLADAYEQGTGDGASSR